MPSPLPPPFCDDKWRKEGISAFLRWVALQLYPWHLSDKQLLGALTSIVHALYDGAVNISKKRLSNLLVKHVSSP
jgi:hypothetical protein